MTSYQFSDDRCKQLFEAAYPVKHFKGFAWRESPQTLDNHWKRATSGKTPAEKDELLKVCLLAGEAQTKYRMEQEKHGERLHRPKGIAVWFNSGSYYDDIGSHAELKEKSEAKKCHCGQNWPCEKHYYDTIKETDWRWKALNEHWQALGKPKTQRECIEALRKKGCLNLLLLLKKPAGKRGGDLTKMGDL